MSFFITGINGRGYIDIGRIPQLVHFITARQLANGLKCSSGKERVILYILLQFYNYKTAIKTQYTNTKKESNQHTLELYTYIKL